MLLNFNAEERALLATVDACIDIPRNTKPAVARKLYDNLKRLVSQLRGLAPVLEARGLAVRTQKPLKSEIRALVAQYPAGASFEEIARWRKAGYSIDTMNALHLADITIRQGMAFEVQAPAPRYEPGQSADPTASLRDAVCDAATQKEHTAAADYHRARGRQSGSLDDACEHLKCADKHALAAQSGSALDSCNARIASRLLLKDKA
jgi:hypothetical protein